MGKYSLFDLSPISIKKKTANQFDLLSLKLVFIDMIELFQPVTVLFRLLFSNAEDKQ